MRQRMWVLAEEYAWSVGDRSTDATEGDAPSEKKKQKGDQG